MISKIKSEYDSHLHLEEILTILILGILSILILWKIPFGKIYILFCFNIALIIFINFIRQLQKFTGSSFLKHFRDLYIGIAATIIFFEHRHLVPLINPHDVDNILIMIDRHLFLGNDPTILLERFTSPVLTEFLQIAYSSYYFLPFTLILLIYFKGKIMHFHTSYSAVLLGLYICYIGYYIWPAIGPRFLLAHLQNFPLTGILTFDYLRNLLNTLEGVTRDCFPSGHTLVSILSALLAIKYYKPFTKIAALWASLIVMSTIYLRYHYVIDVVAGLFIALIIFRYHRAIAMRFIYRKKTKLLVDTKNH
jgi:membrane-associated phospholipid phosphatase